MDINQFRIVGAIVEEFLELNVLDDNDENVWEKIPVNINDYLEFGDPSFRRHFRFSKPVFEILCNELCNHLTQNGRIVRVRTPFAHILLMVLWILATPDTFRSVALRFGVHPGVVHMHYAYVIEAIMQLGSRYITWPTPEERNRTKNNLQRISGFPGIIGMMDGKHFDITRPVEEPAAYRNRHHGYSLLAQAVCDDRLLVRDLYIGEAGSLHDARVFRRSPLCRGILFQDDLCAADEHIIGDAAYMLLDRVMTPFENNGHLHQLQRNYNKRLSKVRVKVEHLFAWVTTLWRRTQHLHVRNMEYAVDHVGASFILHNYRIIHGDPVFEPMDRNEDDEEVMPINCLGRVDNPNDADDPHVPHGAGAAILRNAQIRGVQKRWDICNQLPLEE